MRPVAPAGIACGVRPARLAGVARGWRDFGAAARRWAGLRYRARDLSPEKLDKAPL